MRVEKERKIIKDDGASSSSPGNEWKRKEEEKFVSRKTIIGSGRSREEEQDEVRPKYQEKREGIVNVSIQVSDVFSERSRKKRKKRDGEWRERE